MSQDPQAKFTTGSTFKHILRMTIAGTIGLLAVFSVDVLNMFYIAQLGDPNLTAAIGFAGVIAFFTISFCIGMSIAAAALVSRAMGAGDKGKARIMATANISFMVVATTALVAILMPFQGAILHKLGAEGVIYDQALLFLNISTPSLPLMGIGMACSSILRAVADGRRAMYVTLGGAITTLLLDPILIFVMGLGLEGAAIVTGFSRVAMAGIGLYCCIQIYNSLAKPTWAGLRQNISEISGISIPAVLTNIATPIGGAYVTYALAKYGSEAVAAGAVVNRMIPLAFCGLFALSGAVGPVLGQNYGALQFDRLRQALRESFLISTAYTLIITLILTLSSGALTRFFGLEGLGAGLLQFFCFYVAPSFAFLGIIFVANAAFNTLGKPLFSTAFNWLRATVGTVPFVYYGSAMFGAYGVIAGQGAGGVVFGLAAIWFAFRLVRVLEIAASERPTPKSM